tara:strand:- start:197 stop:577 length:381 start_codon:yes stop_codon:yes gene_type:complete
MSKDPDFVFRLEKAIEEKYGKETVVNPKSKWDKEKEKKYRKELKEFYCEKVDDEKVLYNGILVSKKLFNKDKNVSCSACGVYSFENRDTYYLKKWTTCFNCYIQYIEGREERWLDGWRPKQKTEDV